MITYLRCQFSYSTGNICWLKLDPADVLYFTGVNGILGHYCLLQSCHVVPIFEAKQVRAWILSKTFTDVRRKRLRKYSCSTLFGFKYRNEVISLRWQLCNRQCRSLNMKFAPLHLSPQKPNMICCPSTCNCLGILWTCLGKKIEIYLIPVYFANAQKGIHHDGKKWIQ